MTMRRRAVLIAGGLWLLVSPAPSLAQAPNTPDRAAQARGKADKGSTKAPGQADKGSTKAPARSDEGSAKAPVRSDKEAAEAPAARWPASRPRVEVTATSQVGQGQDNAPWRIFDGWASGLWCEGVEGPGLGEAVTVRFDAPIPVDRVEVQGGVLASGEHFHANDVPIGWRLSTDGGTAQSARDTAMNTAVPSRGPTGLTRFELTGAPIRSVRLQLEGVLRKDGGEHTCISELRIFRDGAEDPLSPVPLSSAAYKALPGDLEALIRALAGCSEAELAARVHFPLWWDVPEASVKAEGGTVTPVTTLKFRTPAELAKTCRERPAEAPRPPEGTSREKLLESLYVEAPDRVALTFPSQAGEEGMRWRLSWRAGRWILLDAQR